MKQGTQSRCSETTQRNGVGREVGGGIQDGGTHVYLWLIHVNVRQKPPQYSNVIILQLKLTNLIIFKKQKNCLPSQNEKAEISCRWRNKVKTHQTKLAKRKKATTGKGIQSNDSKDDPKSRK